MKIVVDTGCTYRYTLHMDKLIAAFRSLPNDANRRKLQAYINRHMMAACLLTAEEQHYLINQGFTLLRSHRPLKRG